LTDLNALTHSGAGRNLKVEGHKMTAQSAGRKILICPSTFLWWPSTWQGDTENRVGTAERREFTFTSDYETCNVVSKCRPFYFHDNFGDSGPAFHNFSLLSSERICGRSWIWNCHHPIKSPVSALPCET